jgi:homopolymeric O-antigen transport system ATP-binding protein
MADFSIRADGLSKQYVLGRLETGLRRVRRAVGAVAARETMWALKDVSFEIPQGQAVALIGRNGAGKSTLLKILAQIVQPTAGYADVRGRVGALLEVGTGFHAELTGRENIYLSGTMLGMRRKEIRSRFDEIVEFSGIGAFIDTPVKRYSSGMYIRLGFAVSAFLEPEILIVDEVLAVGDAEFQRRCLGRMSAVAKGGRTVVFVSHNMQPIRAFCERALLLEAGQLVDDGDTDSVVRRYLASVETSETGRRRWLDPDLRPGNANCRLVEVRVTDASGEPNAQFFSSQDIFVTTELEARAPETDLVLAIDVVAADGTTVVRSYSTDSKDRPQRGATEGLNAYRCAIPGGLLNGGRYMVNVHAYVRSIDGILHENGILQFDVTTDHDESFFITRIHGRPGTIAPVFEWSPTEPEFGTEVPSPLPDASSVG